MPPVAVAEGRRRHAAGRPHRKRGFEKLIEGPRRPLRSEVNQRQSLGQQFGVVSPACQMAGGTAALSEQLRSGIGLGISKPVRRLVVEFTGGPQQGADRLHPRLPLSLRQPAEHIGHGRAGMDAARIFEIGSEPRRPQPLAHRIEHRPGLGVQMGSHGIAGGMAVDAAQLAKQQQARLGGIGLGVVIGQPRPAEPLKAGHPGRLGKAGRSGIPAAGRSPDEQGESKQRPQTAGERCHRKPSVFVQKIDC